MYCTQCGSQNLSSAKICESCQAALFLPASGRQPPSQAATIPNYLVQSILVTLCCCLVPGVVAIVYAAQVNALIQARDYGAARRCSRRAYIWSWVGFGLGLIVAVAYAALLIVGAAAE